jgi:hypothetical protein
MSDSILTSVKKLLGITEDYTYFDADLIIDINSVFMILHQMGVGSKEIFSIADKTATWSDFLGDAGDIAAVKTYVALKVRLMFDPPTSAQHSNAINENIKELEWRLYSADSSENFIVEEGTADGDLSDSSYGTRSIKYRIWADW